MFEFSEFSASYLILLASIVLNRLVSAVSVMSKLDSVSSRRSTPKSEAISRLFATVVSSVSAQFSSSMSREQRARRTVTLYSSPSCGHLMCTKHKVCILSKNTPCVRSTKSQTSDLRSILSDLVRPSDGELNRLSAPVLQTPNK